MSKTVDSRIVEMRFDNAQFERNVKTTMSTLDKLKEKLKFSGASKGLSDLEEASKRVSFSNMENSLKLLQNRFSTTGVIGMRVIQKLTDSAMTFAKTINSFTIGGIVEGGRNRARNLANARFQLQGLLNDENKVAAIMQNVNDAVSGTAYSLDAAASVASQLAASGLQAGDSMEAALKGIAGVAAMTNSEYSEIGNIFTQVAGQGRVMGDQLLQLSTRGMNAAATLGKALGKSEAEIRDMVSKGEIDFNTFATAMNNAFGEHAKKANETLTGSMSNVKASLGRIGAEFYSPLIEQNGPLVKLFNAIREKTNDLKTITDPVAKVVTDKLIKVINLATDGVDKLDIEGWIEKFKEFADNNPFSDIGKKIQEAIKPAEDFSEIVDKVIRGDYGNGQPRFNALTEAGYEWQHIQNLVNERLDCAKRYTSEYEEAQKSLGAEQEKSIKQLVKMSDAELENLGFTKDEVAAFRDLAKMADKTGVSIVDLINNTDQLSVKSLFFNSFKNIGESILNVFKAMKEAGEEVFEPVSAMTIYNILAAIHKKTVELLNFTNENGDEIRRTLAGLAALLDIIRMTVTGGLTFGIKALNAVLSAFGMDTIDLTANIGDLLVKFDKWMKKVDPFTVAFEHVGEGVKFLFNKFKELYDFLNGVPQIREFFDGLGDIDLKEIGENFINGIKNFDPKSVWLNFVDAAESNKVGKALINGFKKGLEEGITSIPGVLLDIGKAMLESIKEVLDIHSPSKKMMEIGEWAIEGLFNGVKSGAGKVVDYLKGLGSDMLGILGNIDWGSVIAVGSIAGFLFTAKKLIDVIGKLGSPFEAISSVIKGVADIESSVSKSIQAKTLETKMDSIKKFAEALLIVAGSIYILGNLNSEKLIRGGIATGIIASVLVIIAAAMSKITESSATIDKSGLKLNGLKTGIASIGTAVLLIGTTVKLLGGMDPDDMTQGFRGLVGVVTAIAAVYAAFGVISLSKNSKYIDKAGKMMKSMATTMLLMAAVVKLVSGLSAEEMTKGVAFATAFSIFVGILGHIGSKNGGNMKDLGKGIRSLVVAMGLLVGAVKLIGMLSVGDVTKGIAFAAGFLVFVATLTAITKSKDGGTLKGLNGLLLSVSASMTLMAGVVKMVSGLSVSEMVKGGIFATAFVVFISALVKATTIAGDQQIAKISGSILAISVAVGIMAGISVLLGMVDTKNLVKGEAAVVTLGAMMAIMVRQLRGANDVGKTMTAMSIAIGVMAGSVAALSFIKTDKLTASTLALSTLMGMFAVVEKSSSVATTSLKTIVMMTAVVAALAGILVLMNKYDFNASAGNAAALATVMLGLSTATVVLGKVGSVSSSAIGAMAGLALIMGGIGTILGLMNQYNLSTNIETVLSLSVVMNALASAALIASKIPPIPVSSSLKIAALMGIVVGISSLIVALAGAVGQIKGAEDFLDNGAKILEKIGTGIGEFLGSIISGFGEGVTSQLPVIGENIVGFMNAFANVDKSSVDGIDMFATFVKSVLSLSVANIVDAIADKIGIGTGLDNFGEQAKKFGEAMSALSGALTENPIDSKAIEAAVNAGQMLSELKASIPPDPGDILKKFVFSRDLGNFGEQAKQFGEALGAMSTALGENPVDAKAIKNAVKAGQMLSGLKANLPEDPGDFLALFTTNQNLGNFGEQAKQFGEALSTMSKTLVENKIDSEAIESAVNAGQMLSALKSSLEGDPGLIISAFTSNQNLGNFGEQAKKFGEALSAMSKAVSGENAIDTEAVENARNAGTMMTELQKALPKDEWFDGVMQLDQFGDKISSFGHSLYVYMAEIGDINFTQINSSLTQAKRMVALANSVANNSDNMTTGISTFKNVKDIGTAMKDYGDSVYTLDADKVSDAISLGYSLKTFISSLKDIDTSGTNSFKDAVSTLSKVELGGIQNTLNDSTKSFETNGRSLVEALNSGVSSQENKASSTMSAVVVSIKKTITDKNEEFKKTGIALITMLAVGMQAQREHAVNISSNIGQASANGPRQAFMSFRASGIYLGSGLVSGINDMQNAAYNAGFALGQAAVKGERAGQQSHSPSKATYQSGIWLGEGMINACYDIATKVFSAGKMLGTGVVNTISTAMQSAEDLLDMHTDVMPVITPVVDLTDIEDSASRITSMFNNPSITPMANIRAINGMMNSRQNGNNNDVVDAINGLRKSLNNTGNTYNNISGITYDNDSAVSEAIESLVRAAKIERRR